VTSFSYRKEQPIIPVIAILSLILVLFQGWVGSLVVSTNLLPGFISVHMSLALLLVALLIFSYHKSNQSSLEATKGFKFGVVLLFLLMLPQIFMGTQVRESIDLLKADGFMRTDWMANIHWIFYIHRSFSILLIVVTGYVLYKLYKMNSLGHPAGLVAMAAAGLILLETAGGAVMAYFDVPAFIQPIHLLLGAMLFGLLFYLILLVKTSTR
jgi:cytochrome c oxidase assembly protein subunit 15